MTIDESSHNSLEELTEARTRVKKQLSLNMGSIDISINNEDRPELTQHANKRSTERSSESSEERGPASLKQEVVTKESI